MSAYSTIRISRGKALQLIMQRLSTANDEQLAAWCDDILAERLYNCKVGYDGDNDDDLV